MKTLISATDPQTPPKMITYEASRWRSERDAGTGTGQKMSWQSVPLTPVGFVLRAPRLPSQFPLFVCTSEDINGRGGGGPLTKWVWRGKGPVCHDTFWPFSSRPVPFLASPFDLHRASLLAKYQPPHPANFFTGLGATSSNRHAQNDRTDPS